ARLCFSFLSLLPTHPGSTLFPYTTLFRSSRSPFLPTTTPTVSTPQPFWPRVCAWSASSRGSACQIASSTATASPSRSVARTAARSEEHTSELQSPYDLVCRLLLEKKKKKN